MRFYDVTACSILVDRQDIRQLSRQDYRRQFGMVLQDAWLYEGTIKENLRFGNLDASDEDSGRAAKAANVDHFIRTASWWLQHGDEPRVKQYFPRAKTTLGP